MAPGMANIDNTAAIPMNNPIAVLSDSEAPPRTIDGSLEPFLIIQWAESVTDHLTIAKLNRISGRPNRSKVAKTALRLAIDHIQSALGADTYGRPLGGIR